MESTIKLLYSIKEHQDWYIKGKKSLLLVSTFIEGYYYSQYIVVRKVYAEYEFAKFQLYIQEKFNAPQSQSWYETINSQNASDEEAFDMFYELLDEFLSKEEKDMESLYKHLYTIRKNPTVHLGSRRNLALLSAYIGGYLARQWEIDENFRGTFALNGFQEFVQKRYDIVSFRSWDSIIDFYTSSDEEAFDTFYRLLDEFLGDSRELYQ